MTSLANKKRSWEDHVTKWPGFSFDSVNSRADCCHGLVADNLKPSMESNEISKPDKEERFSSISLPECYHNSNLFGLQSKQLCGHRREVDENDNHESEEYIFSLEASTETLVHVSDENSDLSCEDDNNEGEGKTSGTEQVPTKTSPFKEIEQVTKNISENSGIGNEPNFDLVPEEGTHCDVKTSQPEHLEPSELLVQRNLSKNYLDKGLDASIPAEELVHTAVVAQQRRKHEVLKDEYNGEESNVADELSPHSCPAVNGSDQTTEVVPVNGSAESQPCSVEILDQPFLEESTLEAGHAENGSDIGNTTANVSKQTPQILNPQENTNNYNSPDCPIKLRKRKVRN